MAKRAVTREQITTPAVLQGWQAIADFLGEPVSVVERNRLDRKAVHPNFDIQDGDLTTERMRSNDSLSRACRCVKRR